MTAAVLSLLLLTPSPGDPPDQATFLREATKGWAALEKAYANVEVMSISEHKSRGIVEELALARVGKNLRARKINRTYPGVPPQFPGQSWHYVTDGEAFFVAHQKEPDGPYALLEYHPKITAQDELSLGRGLADLNEACHALDSGSWAEQVRREGFAITRLETIKDGSRELIRMEFRAPPDPGEVVSVVKGWCLFDPNASYAPVESETEHVQNQFQRTYKTRTKVLHKRSDEFPGLRLVPAKVTREVLTEKGEVRGATTLHFVSFAPCTRKPSDFRPEAFGLKAP